MKFLCIFASIFLAVTGLRLANPNSQSARPLTVECGSWHGFFDVVNPRVTGPRTIITSSNYGKGDYANHEKCAIQFVTEGEPLTYRFRFDYFDVENALSCSYDSACLNGFDYCGQTLAGRTVSYTVPANSTLTYTFTSDSSITSAGFYAVVDALSNQGQVSDDDYQDYCLTQYQEPSPTPLYDTDFDYSTPATEGPIYDYPSPSEGSMYDYGQPSEDNYNYGSDDYNYGSNDYNYGSNDDNYGSNDYSNGDYSYDSVPEK